MKENATILISKYLIDLGYFPHEIKSEVKLKSGHRIDFIVYQNDKPWLAVEAKSTRFLQTFIDEKEIKFNSYVRQLQSYARLIDAPYYLFTDGNRSLWFTTDETGRPSLLSQPIKSYQRNLKNLNFSGEALVNSLTQFNYVTSGLDDREKLILILAKITEEKGNGYLKGQLLNSKEDPISLLIEFENLPKLHFTRTINIHLALEILDLINFTSMNPYELLDILIDIFNSYNKFGVSKWLADFMVRLSKVNNKSDIWDICNINGNLLAAIIHNSNGSSQPNLVEINPDIQSALWSKIKQILFGYNVQSLNYHYFSKDVFDSLPKPSNIITIPHFSKKPFREDLNYSFLPNIQDVDLVNCKSEDIYLQSAMNTIKENGRIVMLVPDSLLFSNNKKKIRMELFHNLKITAIISIGSKAFHPYSNVKSSILVLDKINIVEPYEIFMALIDELPIKDSYNSLELDQPSHVINEFENWTLQNTQVNSTSISWIISSEELDFNNFTPNRYTQLKEGNLHSSSPYPLVPLKEIVKGVMRGQQIKLDEDGSIQVVGPACIRSMEIITSSVGHSSFDKVHKPHLSIQSNDILLNNISTYLGSAALASSELNGSYFSQHVILIRPNISVVLPEYLEVILNSEYLNNQLLYMSTGSVMPSISLQNLKKLLIPLPSIKSQEYIVNELRKLKEKVKFAKQQLQDAEKHYKSVVKNITKREDF
ncbi:N-6 DNA methylase [Bacillus sp. E214]|uniref:N-6 DNA methylase n=1 Tax=Bacillus sp. E214 TaxID=2587156 RepID=UPI0011E0691D|nr:N-6 DNA methylase [Bacillus sp. E214]